MRSYNRAGLVLKRGRRATQSQVKELQEDLRRLGYLRSGIDGKFGPGTERAVKALQHDLLNNTGESTSGDGRAPVGVLDFNRSRVHDVTGEVDRNLARVIEDILQDGRWIKLPSAADPRAANRAVVATIGGMSSRRAPIPFLLAVLRQESNLKHYHEPRAGDDDTYIVVGLDTNAGEKHVITSRGYGIGQSTLFHHPPTRAEATGMVADGARNVQQSLRHLRDKFDHFVNGRTGGTQADDRLKEIGRGKLRLCKYAESDSRYMKDCRQCALDAGKKDIVSGVSRAYPGSTIVYRPTQYYGTASYDGVPVRRKIGCDWPYAVRRYNGSGVNSYHYQARVLLNLVR